MIDLTEMWAALESHQPIADRKGYGEAWRRMCTERTEEATWSAFDAAKVNAAAAYAAYAADAADAADADADYWAKVAVEHITRANAEAAK